MSKLATSPLSHLKPYDLCLIINDFPPLSSFTKIFVLDVTEVLDLPLNTSGFEISTLYKNKI